MRFFVIDSPAMSFSSEFIDSSLQSVQVKEFMMSYNKLADFCFSSCINSFSARNIPTDEIQCVDKCFRKFLKAYTRIGFRLQEYQENHI